MIMNATANQVEATLPDVHAPAVNRPVYLVTGATGLVGYNVVSQLLKRHGSEICVRAMVRSLPQARAVLPAECQLVEGDLNDAEAVRRAVTGVDSVFHAGGPPEQWVRDPSFFDVHITAARNIVEAMEEQKVRYLVYTSTMDTLKINPGQPYDESQSAVGELPSAYQRAKMKATQLILEAARQEKVSAAVIHPSAVYGPGPVFNTLNEAFMKMANNQIPILLQGGYACVFAEDVGFCHVRALEELKRGSIPSGSQFLVSGPFRSLRDMVLEVKKHVPTTKIYTTLPYWIVYSVAQ